MKVWSKPEFDLCFAGTLYTSKRPAMAARNNGKGTVHVLKTSRNLGRALERYDIKYNFRVGQFHWYPVQY